MGLGWLGGTLCRLNQADAPFTFGNLTGEHNRPSYHAFHVENWDCPLLYDWLKGYAQCWTRFRFQQIGQLGLGFLNDGLHHHTPGKSNLIMEHSPYVNHLPVKVGKCPRTIMMITKGVPFQSSKAMEITTFYRKILIYNWQTLKGEIPCSSWITRGYVSKCGPFYPHWTKENKNLN